MGCVDSFSEGRSAWKYGVVGFLTRIQGIAITAAVTFATMSVPWWWPSNSLPATITMSTATAVVTAALLVGGLLISGFIYLRQRTIRSLDVKALLHSFAHYLRDYQMNVTKRNSQRNVFGQEEAALDNFREYINRICEYVKDYFVLMTYDDTINCAIRLAVEIDAPEGKGTCIVYRTIGRSSNLGRPKKALFA